MKKIHIVTLTRLNRALYRVSSELDRLGLWTEEIADIDVYLTTLSPGGLTAYGWKYDGRHGSITIPSVSLPRLAHHLGFCRYVGLVDVLRHEYGHVAADIHYRLTRCRQFREAFGASYESGAESPYDPSAHISEYASSKPAEDFAEVFTAFVRKRCRLPGRWDTQEIRKKWRYVRQLCEAIRRGQRTW